MIVVLLLAGCPSPAQPLAVLDSGAPVNTPDSGDTNTDTGDTDTDTDAGPLPLCINELMPSNTASLYDEDGNTPDWIELHNPGEERVDASGWRLSDSPEEPDRAVLPAGTILEPGGFLLLLADGDDSAGHVDFRLSAEGGSLSLYAPDGRGQIIHYGAVESDFSIARVPDCCTEDGCLDFDFRGTPGISNVPLVWEEVTLLPAGSDWRFWDQGTLPDDADWTDLDYDDTAWGAGPAPLGFGDQHQVTQVYGGPDGARHPTTWMRTRFQMDVPRDAISADSTGWLDLTLDDGAVVWLNGQEALRSNMPDGDISPATLAVTAVAEPQEYTPARFEFDPTLLREGENILAVEVHQASATSSDLTLDAALSVTIAQPAE